MRTEHYLFLVLGITLKTRAKVCAQWIILKLATDRSKAMNLVLFLLYVYWSRCFIA